LGNVLESRLVVSWWSTPIPLDTDGVEHAGCRAGDRGMNFPVIATARRFVRIDCLPQTVKSG
jgi:hypothetical protein